MADVAPVEAARLWSLVCAVQQHDGCGGVFERDGIRVVCPCSCHEAPGCSAPVEPLRTDDPTGLAALAASRFPVDPRAATRG